MTAESASLLLDAIPKSAGPGLRDAVIDERVLD